VFLKVVYVYLSAFIIMFHIITRCARSAPVLGISAVYMDNNTILDPVLCSEIPHLANPVPAILLGCTLHRNVYYRDIYLIPSR